MKLILATLLASVFALGSVAPAHAATAASSAKIKEAQTIMTKFNLPTGTIDGQFGPNTARGLCSFRQVSNQKWSRSSLTDAQLKKLRAYDAKYAKLSDIPAPKKDGKSTYVLVNQTCQTLTYVEGGYYKRVMTASTGMKGHTTKEGEYSLGGTKRGWHCSTIYPESCATHTEGRFSTVEDYGNMYNKRHVYGAVFVHGSTSVPTYPASHGCIRVTPANSDWMYDNVGNNGPVPIIIDGKY